MRRPEAVVLDTHVWLDVAMGRTRFSRRQRSRVDKAARESVLYVASVTPWEVAALARKGKVRVASPVLDFVLGALRETSTSVVPLEPEIAVDAVELPAWDHKDPTDRLIVASARHLDAWLLTRDGAILDYAAETKAVRAIDPAE
jgi:PIN domain nuclease of toxin-antitoxin system